MSNVSNQSWAFTIFRVAIGGVFLAHGIQKFFMYGLHGVAGAFASMGVPAPAVTSALVAVVELLGGAALILGFLFGRTVLMPAPASFDTAMAPLEGPGLADLVTSQDPPDASVVFSPLVEQR